MENENLKDKKAHVLLYLAASDFIGRTVGTALLGFLRASIGAFVLSYPFIWIWNELALEIADYGILEIKYWTGFKILLVTGVIFRRQIVIKEVVDKNVED